MDTDSFLNLLSPGLNDIDMDWESPSDTDFYTEDAPALAWLISDDGSIAAACGNHAEAPPCGPPASSIVNRCTADNIASEYSSVLKLSDIASALHNFSRASGTMNGATRTCTHKASPTQSSSSMVPSTSVQDLTSNVVSNLGASHSSACSVKPLPSLDVCTDSHPSCFNTLLSGHESLCRLDQDERSPQYADMQQEDDEFRGTERECSSKMRESSSKVSSEEMGFASIDDEKNEDMETNSEDEYDEEEDVKPSVAHVRIIRRPNSSISGQGMNSVPKRMKFAACVKVEDGSSCEMGGGAGLPGGPDEKELEGSSCALRLMRKEGMTQREVHILSERQRRKSMRESFSILQSLIPKLKLKHTDRITVLTEVIAYIRTLRGTLEELERKKLDILELLGVSAKPKPRRNQAVLPATVTYVNTDNSSSDDKAERSRGWCSLQNGEMVAMVEVTVRMCGADVFITLNSPRRKGVWSGVLSLLQKLSIEISNATLTSSGDSSFHCIHGKATKMSDIEGVDLQEMLEDVIVKELRRRHRK